MLKNILLTAPLVLTLATAALAADGKLLIPAPPVNGRLMAEIVKLDGDEVFVSILDQSSHDKTVAVINLTSQGASQGRTFVKGSWTPDGQYFVFSTANSGGHSPWHATTFYFATSSRAIRNLDFEIAGSVTEENFTLSGDHTLTTAYMPDGASIDDARPVTLDLDQVEKQGDLK